MVEGTNFLWTHRRAKETGGLSREREALLSYGLYTIVPTPSPFNEGILVVIFLSFCSAASARLFPAAFSCIISNEFVDLFPSFPRLPAGWMVIAIFFLGDVPCALKTGLISIGDRRRRMRLQAFLLQCQTEALASSIFQSGDFRHPMGCQPSIDYGKISVGVRMFAACIGEQDQIYRDLLAAESNQHSGRIGPTAISDNIHLPPPLPYSASLCSGGRTTRLYRSAPHR